MTRPAACDAACAATLITAYCTLITPYRALFGPACIASAAAWIALAARARRRRGIEAAVRAARRDIPDYVPDEWSRS